MRDLSFGKAKDTDRREILEQCQKTSELHFKTVPHVFPKGYNNNARLIDAAITSNFEDASVYVAKANLDLIGYAAFLLRSKDLGTNQHECVATVVDIWVHPDARNQGIAKRLLAYCENELVALGATRMDANVWKGNEGSKSLFSCFEREMTQFSKRIAKTKIGNAPDLETPETPRNNKSLFNRLRKMFR